MASIEGGMTISDSRHRVPPDVIRHAARPSARLALSHRDLEDRLAEPGIDASCETIRCRAVTFGALYARRIRRSRPKPGIRCHLDEMFVWMRGGRVYPWRAVDDEGQVLEVLVRRRRPRPGGPRPLAQGRRPPAEADMRRHFRVGPPTVSSDGAQARTTPPHRTDAGTSAKHPAARRSATPPGLAMNIFQPVKTTVQSR